LAEAEEAARKNDYDGIGFVFTAHDPFCGVDLDSCVDPETGEIEPWATEIL
jgi:primase-polymerase (primpol)-like protein